MNAKYFIMSSLLFFYVFGVGFYFAKIENDGKQLLTTETVLLYHPPEERDFFTFLDDLKYEKGMKDPDNFIKNVRMINFDTIHHECRGQPLEFAQILPNYNKRKLAK